MEDILKDRLPSKFLSFQKGLPNGKIVDGLVHFEEEKLRFCIDSKSIFESFDTLRNAKTRPEILKAEKAFSDDVVKKNAKKISEDYIIPDLPQIMLSCLLDLKMYSRQFTMLKVQTLWAIV